MTTNFLPVAQTLHRAGHWPRLATARVILGYEDRFLRRKRLVTAAGDSFNGGYLAARLALAEPARAALTGHALAGAVIQHRGAIVPKAATRAALGALARTSNPYRPARSG